MSDPWKVDDTAGPWKVDDTVEAGPWKVDDTVAAAPSIPAAPMPTASGPSFLQHIGKAISDAVKPVKQFTLDSITGVMRNMPIVGMATPSHSAMLGAEEKRERAAQAINAQDVSVMTGVEPKHPIDITSADLERVAAMPKPSAPAVFSAPKGELIRDPGLQPTPTSIAGGIEQAANTFGDFLANPGAPLAAGARKARLGFADQGSRIVELASRALGADDAVAQQLALQKSLSLDKLRANASLSPGQVSTSEGVAQALQQLPNTALALAPASRALQRTGMLSLFGAPVFARETSENLQHGLSPGLSAAKGTTSALSETVTELPQLEMFLRSVPLLKAPGAIGKKVGFMAASSALDTTGELSTTYQDWRYRQAAGDPSATDESLKRELRDTLQQVLVQSVIQSGGSAAMVRTAQMVMDEVNKTPARQLSMYLDSMGFQEQHPEDYQRPAGETPKIDWRRQAEMPQSEGGMPIQTQQQGMPVRPVNRAHAGDLKGRTLQETLARIPEETRAVSPNPRLTVAGAPFSGEKLDEPGPGFLPAKQGITQANQQLRDAMVMSVLEAGLPPELAAKIKLPGADVWDQAFSLPAGVRYWYETSAEGFAGGHFQLPADKTEILIDIVAASSGNKKPYDNVKDGIAAMAQDLQGRPVTVGFRDEKSVGKALSPDEIDTHKFANFAGTMQMVAGTRQGKPLPTIDLQMAKMFGLKPEEVAANPVMYETLARFIMKIRDMQNQLLPPGAQPYESWQAQALGWVQQRGSANPDDYGSAMPAIIEKLKAEGIPVPGDKITMETLMDPRTPEVLAPTSKTSETQTMTVETRTLNTPVGARSAEVREALMARPEVWARKAVEEFDKIQRKAMEALGQKRPNPKGLDTKAPSIISNLFAVVLGKTLASSTVSRVDFRGKGTFEGEASPNMRIPVAMTKSGTGYVNTIFLTPEGTKVVLAVLGKAFDQQAMAASSFQSVELGKHDTFTLFIRKTDGSEMPTELLAQIEKAVGWPLNYQTVANGWQIDINKYEGPALEERDIVAAVTPLLGDSDFHLLPRAYSSIYVPTEEYDGIISGFEEVLQNGLQRNPLAGTSGGNRSGSELYGDFTAVREAIAGVAAGQERAFAEWADKYSAKLEGKRGLPLADQQVAGAFGPETGTLGIPRERMPQIKMAARPAFIAAMEKAGIKVTRETVPAHSLKPTQADFDTDKTDRARGLAGVVSDGTAVIVSNDGYVLDGHHRWLALDQAGEDIHTIKVDLPIHRLLAAAVNFATTHTTSTKNYVPPKPDDFMPPALMAKVKQIVADLNVSAPKKSFAKEDVARAVKMAEPLVERAAKENEGFIERVFELGGIVGAKGVMIGPLKKVDRVAEKLVDPDEAGWDANKLRDLIRATVVINDYAEAQAVLDAIDARFEIVPGRVKNRTNEALTNPNKSGVDGFLPSGYGDVLVNVMINGVQGEIQINIPEMIAAKLAEGHKLYEIERGLPKGDPTINRVEEAEAEYYSAALEANSRNNSSVERKGSERGSEPSRIPPGSAQNTDLSGNTTNRLPGSDSKNLQPSGKTAGTFTGTTSFNEIVPRNQGATNENATETSDLSKLGKSETRPIATRSAAAAIEDRYPIAKSRRGECHSLSGRKVAESTFVEKYSQVIGLSMNRPGLYIWHSFVLDPKTGNLWEPVRNRWYTEDLARDIFGFIPTVVLTNKEANRLMVKTRVFPDQTTTKPRGWEKTFLQPWDVDEVPLKSGMPLQPVNQGRQQWNPKTGQTETLDAVEENDAGKFQFTDSKTGETLSFDTKPQAEAAMGLMRQEQEEGWFQRQDMAPDASGQVLWLAAQAKQRGFQGLEELLRDDADTFVKLAEEWRNAHPVETLHTDYRDIQTGQGLYGPYAIVPAARTGAMKPSQTLPTMSEQEMKRHAIQPLEMRQKRTLDEALSDLVHHGLPQSWINEAHFYGLKPGYGYAQYNPVDRGVAVSYHQLDLAASSLVAQINIRGWAAHELHHLVDNYRTSSTEMFYLSSESPRMEVEITPRGIITPNGDLMTEAFDLWNEPDFASYLDYPFLTATQMAGDNGLSLENTRNFIKIEVFAQMGALWTTNPELIRQRAPVWADLFTRWENARKPGSIHQHRQILRSLLQEADTAVRPAAKDGRAGDRGATDGADVRSVGVGQAGPGVGQVRASPGKSRGPADLRSAARAASFLVQPGQVVPTSKKVGRLNYEVLLPEEDYGTINSPDDVKASLARLSELHAREIEKQRRGAVSNEQTYKEAEAMYSDLMGIGGKTSRSLMYRQPGTAAGAAELIARRDLMITATDDLKRQRDDLAATIAAGKSPNPDDLANFTAAMERTGMIVSMFMGARAEAGRAMQILQNTKRLSERAKAVQEIVASYNGPESLQQIVAMLGDVQDPAGLALAALGATNPTIMDAVIELWKNGLLSGPTTHLANLAGNSVFMGMRIPQTMIAGLFGKMHVSDRDKVYMGEAIAQAYGMVAGVWDGLKAGGTAFMEPEKNPLTKLDNPHSAAITGQTFGLKGRLARAMDLVGEGVRTPYKVLGATDGFFRAVNARMSINAGAVRQALKEGKQYWQADFAHRVGQLVGEARMAIAMPGARVSKEAEAIADEALEDALKYTFNEKNGPIGQYLLSGRRKFKVLSFILPFVSTPMNIFRKSLEMTPAAPLSSQWRAEVGAGGHRRDTALAQVAMGSAVAMAVMSLQGLGLVTGGGDPDKEAKRRRREAGILDYSVKIGDKWVEFRRLEPIGTLMGMAADAAEVFEYGTQEEQAHMARMVSMAFAQAVTSKTFWKGLSDLVNAVADPERYGEAYLQNFAGTAVPAAVAQWSGEKDRTVRDRGVYGADKLGFWEKELASVTNSIKARIPTTKLTPEFNAQSLPAKMNEWGEVQQNPERTFPFSPVRTSKTTDDPVILEAYNIRLKGGLPGKEIMGIKLDPATYWGGVVGPAGGTAHDVLSTMVTQPGWKDLPAHIKREVYEEVIADAREAAKGTTLANNPDIINKFVTKTQEQLNAKPNQPRAR